MNLLGKQELFINEVETSISFRNIFYYIRLEWKAIFFLKKCCLPGGRYKFEKRGDSLVRIGLVKTFFLTETETKMEEQVLKTSLFIVVVESKGTREDLNCSLFSSLDELLQKRSHLLRFIHNLDTKLQNSGYRKIHLSTEEIFASKEQ